MSREPFDAEQHFDDNVEHLLHISGGSFRMTFGAQHRDHDSLLVDGWDAWVRGRHYAECVAVVENPAERKRLFQLLVGVADRALSRTYGVQPATNLRLIANVRAMSRLQPTEEEARAFCNARLDLLTMQMRERDEDLPPPQEMPASWQGWKVKLRAV